MTQSSQTQTQDQVVSPWIPQADQIGLLYQGADNAYLQSSAVPEYTGQQVATATPLDYSTQNNALAYGTGTAQNAITDALNGGQSALGAGLGTVQGGIAGLANYAGTNQTAQNIANANQYASGQNISAQTQAAMNAINENYNQNTLPQINTNAGATGNMGSTRTGIAQGVATEGLNNNAASIASQLEANAYNTGLGLSQQQNTNQLSALNSLVGTGTNLVNSGMSGISNAINSNATNTSNDSNIIAQLMGYDQASDNNALTTNAYDVNYPFESVNDLNNIVNLRSAGTQTNGTTTTTTDPSLLSSIGSGLGMAGGLAAK